MRGYHDIHTGAKLHNPKPLAAGHRIAHAHVIYNSPCYRACDVLEQDLRPTRMPHPQL